MRKEKKIIWLLSAWLLAAILLHGRELTALAADTTTLDMSRSGSVSVILKSAGGGETATDGVLTLYRVADLRMDNGDMVYQYTSDFENCGISISDVTDTSLAAAFAVYVTEHGITGTERTIGNDGIAFFSNLYLGLYLVMHTGQSTGFCSAAPFLVSVPMEEYGIWVYDVDASPKTETLQPIPGEPDEPEEPEESEEPVEPDEPEIPEEPHLPQTGQLNWPVWVLAAAGAVIFLAGSFLVLSERKKRTDGEAQCCLSGRSDRR